MFSLQRLLGKEDLFFGLLERAATEMHHCSIGLQKLLSDPQNNQALESITTSRQTNKQLCEEISTLVVGTLVTALEREDIKALATP